MPELELHSSTTPHSSKNVTASYTQLQPHDEHQAFVQPTLVPSFLGSGENDHGISLVQVNFAFLVRIVLYLTGLCLKVKGWFMSCCLGAVLLGTAAPQPCPSPACFFSPLTFPPPIPHAKSRQQTAFLPPLFCPENILLRAASPPCSAGSVFGRSHRGRMTPQHPVSSQT